MKFSYQAFYCAYTQEGVIGHFVCFLMPKEKVALRESMQNVSRSGEKGRTASLWLVGESRFLYVRTKGNIAEALSYNLLMYRGGHIGKREFICQSISMEKFGIQVLRFTNKGILSNLYGVCEYIDLIVKNRLKKLQDS